MNRLTGLFCLLYVVSALPVDDQSVSILEPTQSPEIVLGADGIPIVVNPGVNTRDDAARFNPDEDIVYHLFTRQNPNVSQPIVIDDNELLGSTNYNPQQRTVVIIHGWMNSVTSDVNTVLIPAFLEAEDVNVIGIDWSVGADTINYLGAVDNVSTGGVSIAAFLNRLNQLTGATPASYHIVGHSLGGHMAGIVGRNMESRVAYITALDPALPGWITNDDRFDENDGEYTEVIHTNAGVLGFLTPLGQVDFYPNGGSNMPGCLTITCDHSRSFHYLGESITSGGFNAARCSSYLTAAIGLCDSSDTLPMGGLTPKTGSTGVFHLDTNSSPPFSRD